jgi:hypothetical protein
MRPSAHRGFSVAILRIRRRSSGGIGGRPHGQERFPHVEADPEHGDDGHAHDDRGHVDPHESPWVVTLPLIGLAVLSVYAVNSAELTRVA